jgi:heme exporter protein B
MLNYVKVIMNVVYKDFLMELKSKDITNSMLVYAILIVVIFSFIIDPAESKNIEAAGGILWISAIFSGLLGLNRAVLQETVNDSFVALTLAPVDKSAIFFGKVMSITLFMLLVETIIIPVFMVFYNINVFANSLMPVIIFFLGTYGFALLGTLFSFIANKTNAKELLLPLILLPLVIPVILSAVKGLNILMTGEEMQNVFKWIKLLLVFDVIFTAAIFMLVDKVFEE